MISVQRGASYSVRMTDIIAQRRRTTARQLASTSREMVRSDSAGRQNADRNCYRCCMDRYELHARSSYSHGPSSARSVEPERLKPTSITGPQLNRRRGRLVCLTIHPVRCRNDTVRLRDSPEGGLWRQGRSKRASAMIRKEIALEFVIPTMFAIALGLVLALVLSAGTFSG